MPVVAIYDASIFLQALINPTGPAAACLDSVEQTRTILILTPEMIAEIEDVTSRPKIRRKHPRITDELATAFLSKWKSLAIVLPNAQSRFVLLRDPDDEIYLNAAIEYQADFIVTRDSDLLDLMKQTDAIGQRWCRDHPGIAIVDPVAFLQQTQTVPNP